MKPRRNLKQAVAGLFAVTGGIAIGSLVINANAQTFYESGLLCLFNMHGQNMRDIVSNRTNRFVCDDLATDPQFNLSHVDPPYAVGVVRIVDPRTADEFADAQVFAPEFFDIVDCLDAHAFNFTRSLDVMAGQVGCFGEGVVPVR